MKKNYSKQSECCHNCSKESPDTPRYCGFMTTLFYFTIPIVITALEQLIRLECELNHNDRSGINGGVRLITVSPGRPLPFVTDDVKTNKGKLHCNFWVSSPTQCFTTIFCNLLFRGHSVFVMISVPRVPVAPQNGPRSNKNLKKKRFQFHISKSFY